MKKIILITILLTVIAFVYADSPVALTVKMKGDISLSRDNKQQALTEGATLINKDQLRSNDDSFAFIKFVDDGATMRLFANSLLTIDTNREGGNLNKNSFLQVGNVFSSVKSGKGEYSIETPTTVASVRGTEGFVVVLEDGTTIIITTNGVFEMKNKSSGETMLVESGFTGSSDSSGNMNVNPTENIDPDWLDAVDGDESYETDMLKINLENDQGESKTIEIEFK